MSKPNAQKEDKVTMFKNVNSYAFRLKKQDRELLHADEHTEFEESVSPDGKQIVFRKLEQARPNILETANELFNTHEDLMKRLEDL